MEYLEQFPYVIKYNKGKTSIVAYALIRRHTLSAKLRAQILGFDHIHELYSQDVEFSTIYKECLQKSQVGLYVYKGYLFKEENVCIPQGSHRKLLLKEMHEGEVMGHFGVDKTLNMFKEKFVWPHMRRDANNIALNVLLLYKPNLRQ